MTAAAGRRALMVPIRRSPPPIENAAVMAEPRKLTAVMIRKGARAKPSGPRGMGKVSQKGAQAAA
jgi:hypothetical protein